MSEPRSPLKEFRHLDEKLRTVGLSTVEHARWESLRALVAPGEPAPGSGGGFDVDAAAAALRASLQPVGPNGRAPSVELVPEPADAAATEWQPSAAAAWAEAEAGPSAAPVPDPWQADPFAQGHGAGWAPAPGNAASAAPGEGAQAGWDPSAPEAAGWGPDAALAAPDASAAQAWDPSAAPHAGWDPNATAEWDPSAAPPPADPNAAQSWDPNAAPQAEASGSYDAAAWDAQGGSPPAASAEADPDAVQATDASAPPPGDWDPNAVVSAEWDPNAAPQAPWNAGWSAADAVAGLHDPSLGPEAPPPPVDAAPALGDYDAQAEAPAERTAEWATAAPEEAVAAAPEPGQQAEPAGAIFQATPAELAAWDASATEEALPLIEEVALEEIPPAEAGPDESSQLDVGTLDLAEIPEVSADEIEEVFEALAPSPFETAPPAPAGPAEVVLPGTAEPSFARTTAAPPVQVAGPAGPEDASADEPEVVSLEEIVITPPPPLAEALAPPLPLPAAAGGEPDPGPPFVAPPVLVPGPTEPPAEPWIARGTEALADAAGAAWAERGGEPSSARAEPEPRTVPLAAATERYAERFPEPAPEVLAPPPLRAVDGPPHPPVARAGDVPAGDLSPSAAEVATPLEDLAPPPPPGEAAWGGATTFVSGEHRVVLHTVEGQVVRGNIVDADLVDAEVALHVPGGDVQRLPASRLKAVFFMLAPGESPPSALGTKVRVTFGDGRQVAGMSPDYAPGAVGFFVVPVESRTNTGRIWVYRDAVRQISVG